MKIIASGASAEEGTAKNAVSILLNAVDETGEKLSMQQIKDVCFNMLDAGQETTGYTMVAMLSALGRDPAAMQALRDEQAKIITTHGPELTSAALQDMHFADAVIKEALRNASPEPADRMRSITVIGVKKALKTFTLGGYRIPEGYTIITNAAYTNQHGQRWDAKPESSPLSRKKFCPARWLSEQIGDNSSSTTRTDFMPFATGPRACIGAFLAVAELKVALAVLARGYDFSLIREGADEEVKWKSDPFPYPLNNLPIKVTKRL